MEKNGKISMACTYCQKPAVKDTFPPVCEDHRMVKKSSKDSPKTLRELEVKDGKDGTDGGRPGKE